MSLQGSLRRARRNARFNLAVLLTIVVVAYVGGPLVARVVESLGGYNPGHYEPKDFERGQWIQHADDSVLFTRVPWDTLVSIALFLLVAVVWLTLIPSRSARRRPSR